MEHRYRIRDAGREGGGPPSERNPGKDLDPFGAKLQIQRRCGCCRRQLSMLLLLMSSLFISVLLYVTRMDAYGDREERSYFTNIVVHSI